MENRRNEDELSTYVETVRSDMIAAGVLLPESCGRNCRLNFRLRTALGRCFVNGPKKGLIEINGTFFTGEVDDLKVKVTIAHEILHALCPSDGHKGKWKLYALQIATKNKNYHGLPEARYVPWQDMSSWQKQREKEAPKYEIFCPTCHLIWSYKRQCRMVNLGMHGYLKCPKCNTKLKVRLNTKNAEGILCEKHI